LLRIQVVALRSIPVMLLPLALLQALVLALSLNPDIFAQANEFAWVFRGSGSRYTTLLTRLSDSPG
jgi:hypothetical protein